MIASIRSEISEGPMKGKAKTVGAATRGPVTVSTQIKNTGLVERRRRQLISAATKIFIEKGYHQTSIRDIAKATSFSMGNLYDYIRTKEDIYLVHQDMIHQVYRTLFDIQEDEFEYPFRGISRYHPECLGENL